MNCSPKVIVFCISLTLLFSVKPSEAENFRIATYNVENYLDVSAGTRPAKTPESKAKVAENILAAKPDIIAFQEMGSTNALLELQQSLKKGGLDLPHSEHITGHDTNIHVAILSKYPFSTRRAHTNESFLLSGRRFRVGRGFAEVEIKVSPTYSFTLITAHLKSRRPVPEADEADLREQEALKLRAIVDARMSANPKVNLVVLGDLNDIKDSLSTRSVLGRGKTALFDTRPAERNGDNQPNTVARFEPRNITWTHYYGKEDSYSRIDYILLSDGMKRELLSAETFLLATANWGVASDHRLIVAGFAAEEK